MPNPTIIFVNDRETVSIHQHYKISGADPICSSGHSRTQMVPDAVTITLTDGKPGWPTVHGGQLLKSGNVSELRRFERHYYSHNSEDMPLWLRRLVATAAESVKDIRRKP